MKNRSGEKIKLASIDELLGVVNEESAMEIEISKIHPFKNHPFKVLDDEKMQDLVESVKDDGVGFTVDKQKATELFYQQNVKDSLKHSGMGMYISRLYCEKHGGQLLIENEKQSGAVITAVFHRIA